MANVTLDSKLNEAKQARGEWRQDALLVGSVVTIVLLVGGFPIFDNGGPLSEFGYLTNAFTEILSILATVLILDRRAERREKARQREENLQRIIREIGSKDNATAVKAAREAKERGFLGDGSLHGAELGDANLTGAQLRYANLTGAELGEANLSGTELGGAKLEGAHLGNAKLEGAHLGNAKLAEADLGDAKLTGADLHGAELRYANLTGAQLFEANLAGAQLWGANLTDTDLEDATFDEKTILPDAKRIGLEDGGKSIYDKYWMTDTDMSRYTNPDHPDFWQPE